MPGPDASRQAFDDIFRLIRSGQLERAERACHSALVEHPRDVSIIGLHGAVLLKLGRLDEAQQALHKAIALEPGFAKPHEDLGRLFLARNAPEEAAHHFRQAIDLDGSQATAYAGLANALALLENPVEAERQLRRVIELTPGEYSPCIDLGRFLLEQCRFPEAIEAFEQAVALNDQVADNFNLLGYAQARLGRSADALVTYRVALRLDPGNAHALTGLGHMLRIEGKRDEAIAAYEQCTAAHPEFGEAWWSLASLRAYRLSGKQVQHLNDQITSGDIGTDSGIAMRFALARAAETRGDFDAAWQAYGRANALKRKRIYYDPVQLEKAHDAIIEQFDGDFGARWIPAPASQPTPIFIVGMPRSGSTLLEQILASHSRVEGTGELPYIAMLSASLGRQRPDGLRYPEVVSELTERQLASLGKAYLYHSSAHRSLDLPCFTDKMPSNFSHVGLISMILPHAKIIDARRHPLATCVANYRQLYAQGKNQCYDLVEIAEYYLEYLRIMDHWQEVLPGRVLRVQYEDVVADLQGQARRILDFCELPWEEACLEFHRSARPVNTASADQVREPIFTDALDFWRNYEPHLGTLREILAPVLPR